MSLAFSHDAADSEFDEDARDEDAAAEERRAASRDLWRWRLLGLAMSLCAFSAAVLTIR